MLSGISAIIELCIQCCRPTKEINYSGQDYLLNDTASKNERVSK